MAGAKHLHRLPLKGIIVPVLRQARMKERISGHEDATPLALEGRRIVAVGHMRTAGELVMNETRVRRVDCAQPAPPDAQAIIEIVVYDVVTLIEAAERLERLAARHETGAGHCDDVALRERQTEIAGIVSGSASERVSGDAEPGQKHTGMLHMSVRVQQLRADRSDFGPFCMFQ